MANLEEMAEVYRKEGYTDITAEARVCQDVVLKSDRRKWPGPQYHCQRRRRDAEHHRQYQESHAGYGSGFYPLFIRRNFYQKIHPKTELS